MLKTITRIFGDSNEKDLKKLQPLVAEVNELEPEYQKFSDVELRAETDELKKALAEGYDLDDLMAEAFAAVREASRRTLGERHYDVQLLGGAVLHQGKIAEMRTGEGKTLVATLPAYLNALSGKGVHVVTVNDYLAKRDTQWMGPIYHRLGISVGCLQHEASFIFDPAVQSEDPRMRSLRPVPRREAYQADITYGTNVEFGFDYLRDNMVVDLAQQVQRGLNYAIVDEVDNILIDEARTPLIISGQSSESAQYYVSFARLIPSLRIEEDYTVDEKLRTVSLSQSGITKLETALHIQNLYDPANYLLTHYIDNALKAHAIYKRDVDYVVKDGEVILVDEFTGRLMFGRRLSDGLHQAIEAKEGVKVQPETVTLATVTIQNYFRMYKKLAGMTGTAATEGEEFFKTYKLEVVAIPTHRPMIREAKNDLVYKSVDAKWNAVAQEVESAHKAGRPVLVGTVSIEASERLSGLLTRKGVPHEVLNAKQHEKEAGIVAQAGRQGAVTVATNMAGRGTDIVLGGTKEGRDPAEWKAEHDRVVEVGGLYIVGTEHHEARRIDNQLRGRSGRQGDPGLSRFYVSVEDDLMRRFGADRLKGLLNFFGIDDETPIESGMMSRSLEQIQVKVETYNFDIRKRLLEYDDVVNKHREIIYGERRKILEGADLKANVKELVRKELEAVLAAHLQNEDVESWDLKGLTEGLKQFFPLPQGLVEEQLPQLSREEAKQAVLKHADELYEQLEAKVTPEIMRLLERMVMLRTVDTHWVEHLTFMENMRQGVGLQGIGGQDPLNIYKKQGIEAYGDLTMRIQNSIARSIYQSAAAQVQQMAQAAAGGQGRQAAANGPVQRPAAAPVRVAPSREQKAMAAAVGNRATVAASAIKSPGRNDPCPCGSGRKYKKCHGA